MKVGVHEDRVAAVADDVQPVAILMVEAERHAGQRRIGVPRRPCISCAVGRIESGPPLASWAIMNLPMSAPDDASAPAGAIGITSYGSGLSDGYW